MFLLIYPKITIMDYRINFDEPIPQMIERLKQEHIDFESTLKIIAKYIDENKIKEALLTLHNVSESIIKHAVEEEARLMRVIMQKAKDESTDSIKIMQEHNWVVDFLKHKLQNTDNEIHQQYPQQQQQQQQLQEKVKKEINEFIANLRNHFSEEEQIVFPLALKADSN
jgi:NADH dehydrogenase/NADH:ubiquinone oxidoreductase subunit G